MPHRTHVSVMNIGKSMFLVHHVHPGVRSWKETIEFPCNYPTAVKYYDGAPAQPVYRKYPDADGNDCSEELQKVPS